MNHKIELTKEELEKIDGGDVVVGPSNFPRQALFAILEHAPEGTLDRIPVA